MEVYLVLGGEGESDRPRCNACLSHIKKRLSADPHIWLNVKVICTGYKGIAAPHRVPESVLMREFLISKGIPRDAIITEEKAQDTFGNFVFSYPIIEALRANKVFLVTDSGQMPRAAKLFSTIFGNIKLELIPAFVVSSRIKTAFWDTVYGLSKNHPDAAFYQDFAIKMISASRPAIEYAALTVVLWEIANLNIHDFDAAKKYLNTLPVYGDNSAKDSIYAEYLRKVTGK